jgi:hypothetical protein
LIEFRIAEIHILEIWSINAQPRSGDHEKIGTIRPYPARNVRSIAPGFPLLYRGQTRDVSSFNSFASNGLHSYILPERSMLIQAGANPCPKQKGHSTKGSGLSKAANIGRETRKE